MSFNRDTIRTARKEHKCDLCNGAIAKGEKYHDKAGNVIEEAYIYSAKECEACQFVLAEYIASGAYDSSEGYCDEYIHNWWRQNKCYECQHHYLSCNSDNCMGFMDKDRNCSEYAQRGNCKAGDTCDDMTHYCRCEKFVQRSKGG